MINVFNKPLNASIDWLIAFKNSEKSAYLREKLPLFISYVMLPAAVLSIHSMSAILIIATLIGFLTKKESIKISQALYPLVCLSIYVLFSSLWSIEPSMAVEDSIRLAALLAIGTIWLSLDIREYSTNGFLIGLIIAFGLFVFELQTGGFLKTYVFPTKKLEYVSSKIIYNQPSAVICVALWFVIGGLLTNYKKIIATALFVFSIILYSFLDSEAPRLALLLGTFSAISCFFFPVFFFRWLRITLFVGVLLAPLIVHDFLNQEFINKLSTFAPSVVNKYDFHHRPIIWNFCAQKIKENPVFGHGINTTLVDKFYTETQQNNMPQQRNTYMGGEGFVYHPHNGAVQWWLDLGLIGVLLCLWTINNLITAIENIKAPQTRACLAAALTSGFLITSVSYSSWQVWWMSSIFLLVGLNRSAYVNKTIESFDMRDGLSLLVKSFIVPIGFYIFSLFFSRSLPNLAELLIIICSYNAANHWIKPIKNKQLISTLLFEALIITLVTPAILFTKTVREALIIATSIAFMDFIYKTWLNFHNKIQVVSKGIPTALAVDKGVFSFGVIDEIIKNHHIVCLISQTKRNFPVRFFESVNDFAYWLNKNNSNVKRLIYVGPPGTTMIHDLINLSTKEGVRLLRAPYTDELARYESLGLFPVKFNDLISTNSIQPLEREKLFAFFQNKVVWLSYSDEPLILSLIELIAQSGTSSFKIFTTNKNAEFNVYSALSKYKSLNSTVVIESMEEVLNTKLKEIPDIIFLKSHFTSEQILSSLRYGPLVSQRILDAAIKLKVKNIFLISESIKEPKSLSDVTQRLSEIYFQSSDMEYSKTGARCFVLRVPSSLEEKGIIQKEIELAVENKGRASIPMNPQDYIDAYPNCDLLAHLVKMILLINDHDGIPFGSVITTELQPYIRAEQLAKIFLSLKGLRINKDLPIMWDKKISNNELNNDSFALQPEQLIETPFPFIFYTAKSYVEKLDNLKHYFEQLWNAFNTSSENEAKEIVQKILKQTQVKSKVAKL